MVLRLRLFAFFGDTPCTLTTVLQLLERTHSLVATFYVLTYDRLDDR